MQEVEVLIDAGTSCVISESCNSVVFVDGGQLVFEELVDAFAEAYIVQSVTELIAGWEHDWSSGIV